MHFTFFRPFRRFQSGLINVEGTCVFIRSYTLTQMLTTLISRRFFEEVAKICITTEKPMILLNLRSLFLLLILFLCMKHDSVLKQSNSVIFQSFWYVLKFSTIRIYSVLIVTKLTKLICFEFKRLSKPEKLSSLNPLYLITNWK